MTKIEKIKIPKDEAYGGNVYDDEFLNNGPLSTRSPFGNNVKAAAVAQRRLTRRSF